MKNADSDVELADRLAAARRSLGAELGKVIIGQEDVIEELLIALFAGGHCLLVGVPGLAKTLLVSSIARVLDLEFSRIQFTPDLMPSDITGSEILQEDPQTRQRVFRFARGPGFANLVLADEINRTPPKTQAALLQAMQEQQVTAAGTTHALPLPFFVLATQNPIEQEGTYPLPEAQLDRFLLQVSVDYPSEAQEKRIAVESPAAGAASLSKVLTGAEVMRMQELVRRVPAPPSVVDLAVGLARATRPRDGSEEIRRWVSWGAGPRASQSLVLAAKARAVLSGRAAADASDVVRVAKPVLRHRLVLSFQAEADGVRADDLVERVLKSLA
ncbi:MAG TPA: MoxR family ATPase [Elusimicrobiota bacterium]|nr:MoxR family ATPase [Elusimicrobiota bacterium]